MSHVNVQLHFYMPTHIYVSFPIIIHTQCNVGCGTLLTLLGLCVCVCVHVRACVIPTGVGEWDPNLVGGPIPPLLLYY